MAAPDPARPESGRSTAWSVTLGVLVWLGGTATGNPAAVPVPNASFEAPVTPFVNVDIAAWEEAPRPAWFDEAAGFTWNQLTGVFKNTAPGATDHITNIDGNQAAWLFARPDVAIYQDYETIGGGATEPSHEFAERFEVGRAYRLTVGLIGGGGNMSEGAAIELRLYYRGADGQRLPVAVRSVAHSLALFPTRTRFVDFRLSTPPVHASDPWAGQHIGIEFRSVVSFELEGGFWDLDHVRLERLDPPQLSEPSVAEGRLRFLVRAAPETRCEVLVATDLAAAEADWTVLGTLDLPSGEAEWVEPVEPGGKRFYRARLQL